MVALSLLVLVAQGCVESPVIELPEGGSPIEGGSEGGGEGGGTTPTRRSPQVVVLSQTTGGFSGTGGMARSRNYIHFSDPAGLVTGNAGLRSSTASGAVGVNPSEIVFP